MGSSKIIAWGEVRSLHREQTKYEEILKELHDSKHVSQNIIFLTELYYTISVSTADCERGYSRQNIVKTKLRNGLTVNNLSSLLTASINGPEASSLNYLKVYALWRQKKIRLYIEKVEADEQVEDEDDSQRSPMLLDRDSSMKIEEIQMK